MHKKEKVILICKFLPLPAYNGGAIRTLNWIKFLSQKYEVYVVGFINPNFRDSTKELEERFHCKAFWYSLKFSVGNRLRCLLSWHPASIKKYYSEDMLSKVKSLVEAEKIQKVFCSELCTAQYPMLLNVDYTLDDHNIEYKLVKDVQKISRNPIVKIYLHIEAVLLKRFEEKALRTCKRLFVTSLLDKKQAVWYNKNTTVVNNTAPESLEYDWLIDKSPSLVFTGNVSRVPNKNGLLHFIKEIFPILIQEMPEIKMYVVWSQIPDIFKKYYPDNISYHENVNDTEKGKIVGKAWIGIVPLYAGSGTRIKILEYWSHKKAVVSTPKWAEGLEAVSGTIIKSKNIEIENTLLALCKNKEKILDMWRENFLKYKSNYSYESVFKEELYADLFSWWH